MSILTKEEEHGRLSRYVDTPIYDELVGHWDEVNTDARFKGADFEDALIRVACGAHGRHPKRRGRDRATFELHKELRGRAELVASQHNVVWGQFHDTYVKAVAGFAFRSGRQRPRSGRTSARRICRVP